jgi:hypothetical protein
MNDGPDRGHQTGRQLPPGDFVARRRPIASFRRTAVVALIVLVAVPSILVGAGSGAQNVNVGTASAYAQAIRVIPTAGELSLGVGFAETLTSYQNKTAIAEARGIDLGIIGSLLAAEGCDGGDPTFPAEQQPQAVHVEARDSKPVKGQDSDPYGGGAITKFAQANWTPFSNAWSEMAPIPLPGLVEVRGARTESTTQYLTGGIREAKAIADIGSIIIGGGAVVLKGLHWEVVHQTGNKKAKVGNFHIGSITIAGTPVPTGDPAAAFDAMNQALAPIGLRVIGPKVREGAGYMFVDPLKIGVVPNATRDQIAGTILGAIQPIREPLAQAFIDQDCGNATYITVLDVVLGSVSGAGSLTLELGGVRATTKDLTFKGLEGFTVPPIEVPSVPDVVDAVNPSGTTNVAAPPVEPAVTAPLPSAARPVRSSAADDKGRLALVAGIGLAMVLLAAEGDRRKMRRAQRAAELEG